MNIVSIQIARQYEVQVQNPHTHTRTSALRPRLLANERLCSIKTYYKVAQQIKEDIVCPVTKLKERGAAPPRHRQPGWPWPHSDLRFLIVRASNVFFIRSREFPAGRHSISDA